MKKLKKIVFCVFLGLLTYNCVAQECKSIFFVDEFKASKKVDKLFSDTCNYRTPEFLKNTYSDFLFNEKCSEDSSSNRITYEVVLKNVYYYPVPYAVSVITQYKLTKYVNGKNVADYDIEGKQAGPNWWGMRRASRLLIGKANENSLMKIKEIIDSDLEKKN